MLINAITSVHSPYSPWALLSGPDTLSENSPTSAVKRSKGTCEEKSMCRITDVLRYAARVVFLSGGEDGFSISL